MATSSVRKLDRLRLLGLSFLLFLGCLFGIPVLWGTVGLSLGLSVPCLVLMVPLLPLLILPWTRRKARAVIRGIALVPSVIVVGLTAVVRGYTSAHRAAAGRVIGTRIPAPYLPASGPGLTRKLGTTLRDAATWRDLTWLLLNSVLGTLLCTFTWALFLIALWYFVLPVLDRIVAVQLDVVPAFVTTELIGLPSTYTSAVSMGIGLVLLALWLGLAPVLMRANAHLTRTLLGPTERAKLALRVQQLAESRAETVDSQAAEIRRIERDLHDGAQARLVALGMNLGMAEELLVSNPDAARELLAEARQSSSQALAELRDLVRGIHPPVLADRGLEGAVRALALDSPLTIDVDIALPGRPSAPVESAMYFAVAETLTNAAKHSQTSSAWVRMHYDAGMIVTTVGDHGRGGAVMGSAGGLQGIRRRLAAFDGTLQLSSPPGGPTVVTMELPCTLSTPQRPPA